jgi:hypothetical protein
MFINGFRLCQFLGSYCPYPHFGYTIMNVKFKVVLRRGSLQWNLCSFGQNTLFGF